MNSILIDNIENTFNDNNSFILPMNIYDILTQKFDFNSNTIFKSKKNCEIISNFIVNKYIITEYYPPTVFKVVSISFDRNPMNTTIKKNGVNYLLNKYFDKFHNVQLKYKNQPILICDQLNYIKTVKEDKENHPFIQKKKKDIFFLPCECCHLIKEDNYLELLQNNNTPKNINAKLDKTDIEEEEEDDIISYQDVNIFNYVGKVVEIEQDKNSLIYINQILDDEENWLSFNQNKQKQYQSKLLNNKWILLFPSDYKSKAKTLEQNLINTGKRFGVNVESPKELKYNITKDNNNNNVLQAMKEFFKSNSPILFTMILILLDPQSKNEYEKLKQYCLEEAGIISQFILVEKMTSLNINFFNSILLQMISKSGSELFRIDFSHAISNEFFFSICGLYYLLNNNGTLTLCLISSYNEYFNNYHLNSITVKNEINQIQKGLEFLFEDAMNNFNIIRNNNPLNFLVYLNNEKQGGENFLTFSIIILHLRLILSPGRGIKGYCIISPFWNKDKGLYFFQINKPKSKSIIYFIYANNTKIETAQLKDITLKLSYYYWNNYNVIPFPSCLKYAEIGLKMMKKFNININNVKQRLLNEPFYL